ncbi:hypothetical protein H70357_21965 [Paenibacillus sp. FSL H7-0357]|uniref:hypothetical protein n=1 Tax=Paenibacillus sp. FSL H7-0357 TaxID=1536774 RepID=UPI0004F886EE|nr:hypothetical protein [Paenibacillus sp. FSL H7-0357]AIQ19076.1 hypothetical protein H70357_21965 [Paenibacillus sp. FSL H7-0357]
MEKFTLGIAVLVFVILAGCSQKENHPTKESISYIEASVESLEKSAAEILSDLANQEFSIQAGQISEDDYTFMEAFGKAFINLYTGAVAEQETVSFKNYIANKNLLQFTNKMLELEQLQDSKGGNGIIFGLDNEFKKAELKRLDNNLYYLELPFSNQGSGMSCKLLVQSVNKSLIIVDLYFGNKDGVDTMATGHPAVRKLDNPKLWDDREWVDGVMEKLEKYETELLSM